MSPRFALGIAVLGVLVTSPRAAEPVGDAESGLAVVPPDGYVAEILGPEYTAHRSVQISVRKPEDGIGVTGCKVIFSRFRFWQEPPYRDGATQEEVNAQFTRSGGTADTLLSHVHRNFLGDVEHIQHEGVQGLRYVLTLPLDGRVWLSAYLDKPVGRISVSCGAFAAHFDVRRREFEAVLEGTTLPR
jgi:hypothetical protein